MLKRIKPNTPWFNTVFAYRFEILLCSLLCVFIINILFPFNIYGGTAQTIYLPLQLAAAIILFESKRRLLWIAAMLALIILFFRLLDYFFLVHLTHELLVLYVIFFLSVTAELFRQMLHMRAVTLQSVVAAICGLLLIGYCGYYIFLGIEVLTPGSFKGLGKGIVLVNDLFYFSYVTILTIGYGEITPQTWIARNATILLALTAYIYSIVVIAAIVGKLRRNSDSVMPFGYAGHGSFKKQGNGIYIEEEVSSKKLHEVQNSYEQHRTLCAQTFNLLEESRERVALSLDEHIGKKIVSMLNRMEKNDAAEQKNIENLRTILGEVHFLTQGLRPPRLENMGLGAAIQSLCDSYAQGSLKVQYTFEPIPPISKDKALSLYRVAQETVNNILEHAGARHVYISLRAHDAHILLDIEDDGKGFVPPNYQEFLMYKNFSSMRNLTDDPKNTENTSMLQGFGLYFMQQRIQAFGGQCFIESSPGKGTHISAHLPI